jgi:hypothetical protein
MREILEQAGLGKSQLHVSESGTYDYSKISYEEGRRRPNRCKTRMPLEESLERIPENSFAVGHLAYTPMTAELLEDFNVLFVGRDIKEIYLSFMIYQIETGRALRDPIDERWARTRNFETFIRTRGDKLMTKYITKILPWMDQPNINLFDFNMLKNNPVEQTKRVVHTLGEYSDEDVKRIVEASFNKPTQTLSQETDRQKYWSVEAHKLIDDLMEKYEVRYSYEQIG